MEVTVLKKREIYFSKQEFDAIWNLWNYILDDDEFRDDFSYDDCIEFIEAVARGDKEFTYTDIDGERQTITLKYEDDKEN